MHLVDYSMKQIFNDNAPLAPPIRVFPHGISTFRTQTRFEWTRGGAYDTPRAQEVE